MSSGHRSPSQTIPQLRVSSDDTYTMPLTECAWSSNHCLTALAVRIGALSCIRVQGRSLSARSSSTEGKTPARAKLWFSWIWVENHTQMDYVSDVPESQTSPWQMNIARYIKYQKQRNKTKCHLLSLNRAAKNCQPANRCWRQISQPRNVEGDTVVSAHFPLFATAVTFHSFNFQSHSFARILTKYVTP